MCSEYIFIGNICNNYFTLIVPVSLKNKNYTLAMLGTCKSARFVSVDRSPFVLIRIVLLMRGGPGKLLLKGSC